MKLRSLHISNVALLKDVSMDSLGDLSVLVGQNGSGKSFLLEALQLLFSEFCIAGGPSSWAGSDYYWYRRRTDDPILMDVALELEREELQRTFAPISDVLQDVLREGVQKARQLQISRRLTFGKRWETASLVWAGRELVQDDQPVSSVVVKRPRKRDRALDDWGLNCFPPTAGDDWTQHPRLLVNTRKQVAFHSSPELDEVATAKVIELSTEYAGRDYREWASSSGITLNERPPTQEEAPELLKAAQRLEQVPAQLVSVGLQELIRGSFRLVSAVRDEPRPFGQRVSQLPQAMVNAMNSLLADREPRAETRARQIRTAFRTFTDKGLDDHEEGLLVEDNVQMLPVGHQGGGEQAVLNLTKEVFDAPSILAIEEPETHLHPVLERKVFRFLKGRAGRPQLLISTHSPIMMDKQHRQNNWLCRLTDEDRSVVERVEDDDMLRLTLAELGCLPSDVYLKDLVVLVEGGTEAKAAFPVWSAAIGQPLPDNVGVFNLGGKDKLLASLRAWLAVAEHTVTQFLAVLDAGSQKTKDQIIRELRFDPDRIKIAPWRCLEDTYPDDVLRNALRQLLSIDLGDDLPKINRAKYINRKVTDANVTRPWKMQVAWRVCGQMTQKQVPKGFRDIRQLITSLLPD